MTGKIVLSLSDNEMRRIDETRGGTPRATWALRCVRRALDRAEPARRTAEEKLARLVRRGRGGYPVPLEPGEYPTIAELAQVVPVALPPKLAGPGSTRNGDIPEERFYVQRCIWMSWMENTGWPWTRIAEEMGYRRIDFAQQALSRYIAERGDGIPAERRSVQRGHLLELIQVTLDDIRDPGYLHDIKGALLRDPDGSYAVDRAQRTRSSEVLVKILNRLAAVEGSDPAVEERRKVDTVDWQARALELAQKVMRATVVPAAIESGDEGGAEESDESARESPAETAGDDTPGVQGGEKFQDDSSDDEDGLEAHGS